MQSFLVKDVEVCFVARVCLGGGGDQGVCVIRAQFRFEKMETVETEG